MNRRARRAIRTAVEERERVAATRRELTARAALSGDEIIVVHGVMGLRGDFTPELLAELERERERDR